MTRGREGTEFERFRSLATRGAECSLKKKGERRGGKRRENESESNYGEDRGRGARRLESLEG